MPTRQRIDMAGYHHIINRGVDKMNAIEARLSKKVGEYPFTLAHTIFNSKDFYPCTKESILFSDYDIQSLSEFLGVEFSQEDLTFLQIEQNRKLQKKEDMVVLSKSKSLEEHFMDVQNKQERNCVIFLAYAVDGYSQIEIANYLGLSKSAIS